MGIIGLWDEVDRITTSARTTLAQESAKCMIENGRPLRLAVDASILLFKVKHATEAAWRTSHFDGMNHAAKAFINNAKDIMLEGVEPVYVFDGPGRPPIKRGHRTVTREAKMLPFSTPVTRNDIEKSFEIGHVIALGRRLLNIMEIPIHDAPGEAEAECVALERAGIVDGVLTTDGDALAFGGRIVLRYRGKVGDKDLRKVDAHQLEDLERNVMDWILLGWLSKGDYTDGLAGCGAKTALVIAKEIKAARPQLCPMLLGIATSTKEHAQIDGMMKGLRNSLTDAILSTCKGAGGKRETDFPSAKILGYYVRPLVSSIATLDEMKRTFWKAKAIDYPVLRQATAEHFTWYNQDRARQFLRNFAPACLARDLLLYGHQSMDRSDLIQEAKPKKQKAGSASYIKVQFNALDVVPIDYDNEIFDPQGWYDVKNNQDPHKPYTTELPEFLVRWGAPSALETSCNASASKKRKSSATSNEKASKKQKSDPVRQPLVAGTNASNSNRSMSVPNPSAPATKSSISSRFPPSVSQPKDVIDLT
ncbi:flap endonuclease gen like 1 [Lecanosticta acicola]|uniref:Flap endonuclease gen like 1 n=1 Tax=Lecanosticta acicola TaxID=111012 RepID=A0AAI8Z713_9PEZI|nr:flap endonuclease gen like 1 [Lecanosticta acicola]